MNSKIKNVALATLLGASTISAQDSFDYRIKSDFSGDLENNTFVETLGFGPNGNYDVSTPLFGQFGEIGRLKYTLKDNNGKQESWTTLGARIPSFTFGGLTNKLYINTSFGDKSGVGIENVSTIDNYSFNFVAESSDSAKASRIGGGAAVKLGKLELEAGDDIVFSANGNDVNQLFGRARYSINKNNSTAIAVALNENGVNDFTKVGGFFVHYGKDSQGKPIPLGARLFGQGTFYENGDQVIDGELILAQRPTAGPGGISAALDRKVSEDGTWNVSPFPNSFPLESIYLPRRTFEGASAIATIKVSDIKGVHSEKYGAGIAYLAKTSAGEIGASLQSTLVRSSVSKDSFALQPGIEYKFKNLEFSAGANIPLDNQKPSARVSLQYSF